MTDRYKNIRRALAMGPTPGPWSVRYDYVVQAKSSDEGRLVPIAQPYGLRVAPDHLFLGTQQENIADMHMKGRGPRGYKRDPVTCRRNAMKKMNHRNQHSLDAAIDAARSTPATEKGAT